MTTEKQPFLQDLQARLTELLRSTPAADVERNVKALVGQAFQRLELVTRDELDTCAGMLASLSERVSELERTVAALERERADRGGREVAAGSAGSAETPTAPPTD